MLTHEEWVNFGLASAQQRAVATPMLTVTLLPAAGHRESDSLATYSVHDGILTNILHHVGPSGVIQP